MKLFTLAFLFTFATIAANSQSGCPVNLNFGTGDFTNWQCYTGTTGASGCTTNTDTVTPSTPIPNRHTIIAPSINLDPFGGFPITPTGVTNVARLGMVGQIGAQVERISYSFTVPSTASQYSLTFYFAVVYQEPNHCAAQQPHFSAKIFDSTTQQYLPCATVEFFAAAGAAGFQLSTNTSQGNVYYRPWTPFTAILDSYAGHKLRLEFTNADCTPSGHWAYSYIAVPNSASCNAATLGNTFCQGTSSSIVGPFGYQAYNWWNANFTQNLGSGQTMTIPSTQTGPVTYALDLVSYAGAACRDTINVTIQPSTTVLAANAGPDATICGGAASVTLGIPAVAGLSYSWSPTSGLSNPNTAQPTVNPTSTTSYIMTATDLTSGCVKKDTVTVFVNSVPATFGVNNITQCFNGNSFQFTMTNAVAGSTYVWSFGDGSTSTQQNPLHVYVAGAGTYPVKVIVTNANGCKDSTTQTMNVITTVPAANVSLSGNVLNSTATTGNQWYLNGNAIPGATGQNYTATVAGNYSVIVTLNNCSSPVSNIVTYTVTGIDAIMAEWRLQMAPNPTKDKLVITYGGNQKLDLEVLDLAGRQLYSSKNIPASYTVDLSRYLNGSYLVRLVNSKTKQEVKKVIVKL